MASGSGGCRVVGGVSQHLRYRDEREKQVLRLWRDGDVSQGTARTYLDWVLRFYAYCERLGLDDVAELTLECGDLLAHM